MLECIEGKQIFTSGTTSVSAAGASHYMPECNHEEADTRMLLHLQDALENGANTCLVCTVDTDVIVIIVEKVHYLREQHPAADVWIEFGTGRNFRYLHINAICNALGREKAIALPIFTQLLAVIYNFYIFWEREEVSMACIESIPRGYKGISLHG